MNNSGFDFEFDINDSNDFLRIGRNNTGTEISLCKNYPDSGGRPLVAWLDSEGAVNSIFATSIADFFQVFPYLNGMVYDILFKLHAHCKYPANIVSPDNYYTTDVVSN
jgi:hypothetical protein